MGTVAIRLDDIHARTPITLLEQLDRQLWRGRPVTLAAIPYPARLCLGPSGTRAEIPGPRSTLADPHLTDYLDVAIQRGDEVALHGLTHADHKSPAGPAVPELVAPAKQHNRLLHRTLDPLVERHAVLDFKLPSHVGPDQGCDSAGIGHDGYLTVGSF